MTTLPGIFVDGRRRAVADGARFDVVEPATGAVIAEVADGGPAEVDAAVAAARRALDDGWRATTPRERAGLLRQVAALIRTHLDELAELETREVGKPMRDARRFDLTLAHLTFDFYAGAADALDGTLLRQGPIDAHVVPTPYGVVAAILPFNWPPIHFANKVAPALLAGNAVVLKPGEQAPLTALRLVELAAEILPPGVLNAVSGAATGPALCAHPGVDRISFTGSSETGRRVLAGAAKTITPASLELGGKNALIVFADADLETAVAGALEGMYFNQGEACTSTSRILVEAPVHDAFLERFAAATRRLVVGDGLAPETAIGPMVDARQRDRVEAYLALAETEGARVVAQAPLPDDPRLADGFWVAPTVLAEVRHDMRIAREEIFGPVACIMRFDGEEEAVEIANGSEFGLTAAVFSADDARAARVADRLEVGMVFVNNYFRGSLLGSPFGGVKASGFGREGTRATLAEMTYLKNIRVARRDAHVPRWAAVEEVTG